MNQVVPSPRRAVRAAAAALAAAALATSLAACVSTAAVSTYARSAGDAMTQLPTFAADYYASCLRRSALAGQSPPGSWVDTAAVRAACVDAGRASAAVEGQHRVLAGYFAALAALADDKVIVADTEFAQLGTALAANPSVTPAQASAVTGIARLLTTSATDGLRRNALRRVIVEQNDNVQQVVRGLRAIVGQDYAGTLGLEGRTLATVYRSALQQNGAQAPLAALVAQDLYAERSATLARRQRAAAAYDTALRSVARGHQHLTESRDRLGDAALRAWAVQHAANLSAALKELDRAF